MKTITYKIEENRLPKGKLTRVLIGCQGLHKTSEWYCSNCHKSQRDLCLAGVNAHPDTGIVQVI